MSVAFEVIETPYPYLCAVYTCPCGARAMQYADEAAVPPSGWHVTPSPDGDRAVCPVCAAQADAEG